MPGHEEEESRHNNNRILAFMTSTSGMGENRTLASFVSKISLSPSQGEVQLRQPCPSEACPGGFPTVIRAWASFLYETHSIHLTTLWVPSARGSATDLLVGLFTDQWLKEASILYLSSTDRINAPIQSSNKAYNDLVSVNSSVQSLSHVQHFTTAWTAACQASLSITNSRSLFKLTSIQSVMTSKHLILCHPLLLLPSIFPRIRVSSSESVLCIRWLKYWSFSFNISLSNEHWRLISFRMDWLDLLAAQGTLKSLLLQHHSSKASILLRSPFFIVQLSHLYMTTGKTIALTRWTIVGKVMSLLFNMLSR